MFCENSCRLRESHAPYFENVVFDNFKFYVAHPGSEMSLQWSRHEDVETVLAVSPCSVLLPRNLLFLPGMVSLSVTFCSCNMLPFLWGGDINWHDTGLQLAEERCTPYPENINGLIDSMV
jgi:hypothetical protein